MEAMEWDLLKIHWSNRLALYKAVPLSVAWDVERRLLGKSDY